jgi:hypothetical protein
MREKKMDSATKSDLRAVQQELYGIHAHMSEAMDRTGGTDTEEWHMLYSIMQMAGGITDVIGVYLGDNKPRIMPTGTDPYPANITLDDPSDIPTFTPPF